MIRRIARCLDPRSAGRRNPMAHAQLPVVDQQRRLTMRQDAWWVQPTVVAIVLASFIVYATWAAFQNAHYTYGPYLSPFYSPVIFGDPQWAWFGDKPTWWPALLPFSPALIILPFPGLFRVTCYYYRGAYYKAFWADPPNCAVGEPRTSYWGERSFPLIMQNVHRYFLYLALIFIVLLSWDAIKAMNFDGHFGIGIGTLVMVINPILLGCYTLGCHSLRHLVGGRIDEMSKSPVRKQTYDCVSCLNRKHMMWAWFSLFWVGFT